MSDIENKFWALCDEAGDVWERSADTKSYEPALLKILELVKNNKNSRGEFENLFADIVSRKRKAIFEIVVFCMRELRWHKVLECINNEIKTSSDYRNTHVLKQMKNVFQDDWDDKDLWNYYSKDSEEIHSR